MTVDTLVPKVKACSTGVWTRGSLLGFESLLEGQGRGEFERLDGPSGEGEKEKGRMRSGACARGMGDESGGGEDGSGTWALRAVTIQYGTCGIR